MRLGERHALADGHKAAEHDVAAVDDLQAGTSHRMHDHSSAGHDAAAAQSEVQVSPAHARLRPTTLP